MSITITVVIPTRNRPLLLKRCLESIPTLIKEVVVVEDATKCSTLNDETLQATVLIHLLNGKQKGASFSRNKGAEAASSDWICFVDDDDQLCASYIERMHERIKMFPEVEVWVPDRVGVKNRKLGLVPEKDLMFRNRVGGCSGLLIRKTIFNEIGGFDPDFPSMQDWDLWIRLQRRGALHYSGVSGVVYDSASQGKITHDLAAKYQGLRRLYLKHRSYWTAQARRAHLRRLSVLRCLRSGQCGLWPNWFKSGLRLEALYYTYHWRRFAQEAGRT